MDLEGAEASAEPASVGAGIAAGVGKAVARGEAGGVGEQPVKPRKHRPTQQQKVRNQGGVRTVRWYSVNGPELKSLATLQGVGGVLIAVATFLGGVWLSTKQALEMTPKEDVSAATRASWETVQTLSGYAAIACLAVAAILLFVNGVTIWQIYRAHEHEK